MYATQPLSACKCAGEPGDRVQFSEFIRANIKLYELRNNRTLSTSAIANFIRAELATALRSVSMHALNAFTAVLATTARAGGLLLR